MAAQGSSGQASFDLPTIRNELTTVAHKASQIGIQLGLGQHIIRGFLKKDDPLEEIIGYWLGGNVEEADLSWKSIVKALKSGHVGEIGLGNRIDKKYCKNKGLNVTVPSSSERTFPDGPATEQEAKSKIAEKPALDQSMRDKLYKDKEPISRKQGDDLEAFSKKIQFIVQTVNDNEYKAAVTFMEPPSSKFQKAVIYPKPGMVVGKFAGKNVALIKTGAGSKCRSFLERAIKAFSNVKYIICVGVGYAFSDEKCKLADVMVSDKISDFADCKFDKDGEIEDRGQTRDVEFALYEIFCLMTSCKDYKVAESGRISKVHCGSVCSYPALFDNKDIRDKFKRKLSSKAIGGEMEGGVLLQLQDEKKISGFIIIKGVSDFGDGEKEKVWQFTAAMASLHYTKSKLEEYYNGEDEEMDTQDNQQRPPQSPIPNTSRTFSDTGAGVPTVGAGSGHSVEGIGLDIQVHGSKKVPKLAKPQQAEVTKALKNLLNDGIDSLGTALGLSYPHVSNMQGGGKLNQMVLAWLNGEDDVKTPPTWDHLVQALRDIGHNGIAKEIEKNYL